MRQFFTAVNALLFSSKVAQVLPTEDQYEPSVEKRNTVDRNDQSIEKANRSSASTEHDFQPADTPRNTTEALVNAFFKELIRSQSQPRLIETLPEQSSQDIDEASSQKTEQEEFIQELQDENNYLQHQLYAAIHYQNEHLGQTDTPMPSQCKLCWITQQSHASVSESEINCLTCKMHLCPECDTYLHRNQDNNRSDHVRLNLPQPTTRSNNYIQHYTKKINSKLGSSRAAKSSQAKSLQFYKDLLDLHLPQEIDLNLIIRRTQEQDYGTILTYFQQQGDTPDFPQVSTN